MSSEEKYRMDASSLDAVGCDLLVCMPYAYRELLLDWATRLHWTLYVTDGGNRVKPDDEQEAMLQAGYKGLVEGMCLDSVVSALGQINETLGEIAESGGATVNVEAVDLTVIEEKLGEIANGIANDGEDDMSTVNVYCGCGNSCGGGGCCSGDDDNMPPDDYIVAPIEIEEPETVVLDSEKCNRANYLMVQYRSACLSLLDNMSTYTVFFDFWKIIVGAFFGEVPSAYNLFMKLKNWTVGQLVTDMFVNAFDSEFNTLVCIIFSADTATQAKESVREYMENIVIPNVSYPLGLAYLSMLEELPFSAVFDAEQDVGMPNSFYGRECCGDVPLDVELPALPSSYAYVPAAMSSILHNQEQSSTAVAMSSGRTKIDFSTVGDDIWGFDLRVFWDNLEAEAMGDVVGMLFQTLDYTVEENRAIKILKAQQWGEADTVVGNNDDIILVDSLYEFNVVRWAFGDTPAGLDPSFGDDTLITTDAGNRDGAYSQFHYGHPGSPTDSPSGSVTIRAWHIVKLD